MGTKNNRIEVLEFIEQAVIRLREAAANYEGQLADGLLGISNELETEMQKLETELIESRYIPSSLSDA
jgi:hypothetical protein